MKRMLSLLLALTMTAALTGCGGADMSAQSTSSTAAAMDTGYYAESGYYDDALAAAPEEMAVAEAANGSLTADRTSAAVADPVQEKKIIRTASIRMQTLDFNQCEGQLEELLDGYQAYIQDSTVSGGEQLLSDGSSYTEPRYASYTVRVPEDQLDGFLNALESVGNVIETSISSSDISDVYYDTQARLENMQLREERLQELLEQADTLENLLTIETELNNVRLEIEQLTATMDRYDQQVALSTVYLNVEEVRQYVPAEDDSFTDRLLYTMSRSWQNFLRGASDLLFTLVYLLPTLIVLAVVLAVVMAVLRRKGVLRSKKAKAKPDAPVQLPGQETAEQQPGENTPPEQK